MNFTADILSPGWSMWTRDAIGRACRQKQLGCSFVGTLSIEVVVYIDEPRLGIARMAEDVILALGDAGMCCETQVRSLTAIVRPVSEGMKSRVVVTVQNMEHTQ